MKTLSKPHPFLPFLKRPFSTLPTTLSPSPNFPTYNSTILIARGSSQQYKKLRQHAKQLKNHKFYLYQREPIDISLEMVKKRVKCLTYISRENYETVEAVPVGKGDGDGGNGGSWDEDGLGLEESVVRFMSTHKFVIRNSYLDIHPFDAYHSLCSFLNTPKSPQISQTFTPFPSFSLSALKTSPSFLPYLQKQRKKYLKTEGELKLKKLDRIRSATQEQVHQAMKVWKDVYDVQGIYGSTREDEEIKRRIVVGRGLGEDVGIWQLVEGYGEKSFYAGWGNQGVRK